MFKIVLKAQHSAGKMKEYSPISFFQRSEGMRRMQACAYLDYSTISKTLKTILIHSLLGKFTPFGGEFFG
ncbi:hypothetical protein PEDI_40180 [Persicobacter diffluens]|uniref:Uncharacterized protein n=1 Tax=Persicobacter diffluens TaxID=981 RepID=A0AAN4W2G1_9BACT|nr:hypothetical protein PEDI_40180 [Persicobacter diffluens]